MDRKNKVMVVEDDSDINELIAYNLAREGFCVEQAFDGTAAQERLRGEHFNVVVLDLMLPDIDGFRICKAIKEGPDSFRTFVVVVSARTDPQDKLYANILGADYYMPKPFSVGSLVGIVKEMDSMLNRKFTVEERNVHLNKRKEAG